MTQMATLSEMNNSDVLEVCVVERADGTYPKEGPYLIDLLNSCGASISKGKSPSGEFLSLNKPASTLSYPLLKLSQGANFAAIMWSSQENFCVFDKKLAESNPDLFRNWTEVTLMSSNGKIKKEFLFLANAITYLREPDIIPGASVFSLVDLFSMRKKLFSGQNLRDWENDLSEKGFGSLGDISDVGAYVKSVGLINALYKPPLICDVTTSQEISGPLVSLLNVFYLNKEFFELLTEARVPGIAAMDGIRKIRHVGSNR